MEFHATSAPTEDEDLRRGPWTVEEDILLMNYIAAHGDGRWNSLARFGGLKRTGKSCRLRWLNYLRPDVRRGNITPEEQLLILELHSRFGNRWSKIAQHLPGRTDNEIKNYWRTRVQKHAKQLRCDVNSKQFKDLMTHLWMPRLVERIRASASGDLSTAAYLSSPGSASVLAQQKPSREVSEFSQQLTKPTAESSSSADSLSEYSLDTEFSLPLAASEISFSGSCVLQGSEDGRGDECWVKEQQLDGGWWAESLPLPSPGTYDCFELPELEQCGGWDESLWNMEDIWLQQ